MKQNHSSYMFYLEEEPYQKDDVASWSLTEQVNFFFKEYQKTHEKCREMMRVMKQYEKRICKYENCECLERLDG